MVVGNHNNPCVVDEQDTDGRALEAYLRLEQGMRVQQIMLCFGSTWSGTSSSATPALTPAYRGQSADVREAAFEQPVLNWK
ncbi:hypothetical protein GCM10010109_41360 [Actinoplanes campanulatus]|nr:hypothetical protein GCM10010109_41360 [Actinoplanes campanulatus]GID39453.1 hypothetical protein Aca09nite_59590 [Actinoplanes campanulatus]